MRNAKREVGRLLRRASRTRFTILWLVVLLMVPCSWLLRTYVFEIVRVEDSAVSETLSQGSFAVFCKLDFCKERLASGNLVLLKRPPNERMIRKLLALPGDTLEISTKGYAKAHGETWNFEGDKYIIADRKIYLPREGETLTLDSLSDIELDFALNILRSEHVKFFVEALPMAGERILPNELAGNTKIAQRPVSLREIPGLPWQDLFLIASQVRLLLHTNEPVTFRRTVFNAEDSTKIDSFTAPSGMYFFACEKLDRCADSREFGYLPKSSILGVNVFSFSKPRY